MPYPFLSPEWMTEARSIRAKYSDESPKIAADVKANLVITDVPFGDGPLHAHLDTSSGEMEMEEGHLEAPHATLTMDYGTAKSFMVEQDQSAVMQAFMSGKIKIAGDMTKLMALQASGGADAQAVSAKVAAEIAAITE